MTDTLRRRSALPRTTLIGLLLFALAYGSVMLLILAPKDLFFADPGSQSILSE